MTGADKHDIHSLKRYLDYQETPQYRAFRDKENPGSAACNFAVIKSAENLGATLAAIEAFYEGTSIVPRISFGPDSIAPAQCRDFLAHKGYGLCRREVCRMFLTAEPAAGYRVARCKTGPVDVRRSRAAALLLIECCGGQEFGLRLIAKQLAHGARAYAAFDGEDVPVSLCVTEGYGRAARICVLYTAKEKRNRGYGAAVLEEALRALKADVLGYEEIFLDIAGSNAAARLLYGAGFRGAVATEYAACKGGTPLGWHYVLPGEAL